MTNIKELSTKCNIISKEQIDERQGARGSSKIYILTAQPNGTADKSIFLHFEFYRLTGSFCYDKSILISQETYTQIKVARKAKNTDTLATIYSILLGLIS
ncbi:hypothetical protein CIRMBP1270_02199 [Enterococcus cecorum]|uniref:hypothetical protein n=1 Tax=Enterococcus cecorum TaxID=44008 RepID=UPI0022CF1B74|nr:hypothetical protein CIRMBP1270_02199 [Enterococcus cecorum]